MNPTDAARLLERLLEDPEFRARFRHDPAATAREAGLQSLADQLQATPQRPLETLEIRQSHSSMAGVMLAAAAEGLGLFQLSEHLTPQLRAETAQAADQPPNRPDPQPPTPTTQTNKPPTNKPTPPPKTTKNPTKKNPTKKNQTKKNPTKKNPTKKNPTKKNPTKKNPTKKNPTKQRRTRGPRRKRHRQRRSRRR